MKGEDALSQKGVLGAVANLPGDLGKLRVVTAHTTGTVHDIDVIARQITKAADHVKSLPTVTMGDFNIGWQKGGGNAEYNAMKKLFLFPNSGVSRATDSWIDVHGENLNPDPYTVEYELNEPFSDLLIQLTMFTTAIHNQESVETLGKDYGIKGIDGTGPWCFESWQPRTEIVLKRHDAYKWGPSMYKNKGPVKFDKLSIKIVPEDASRVAAIMGGQFDLTHQVPLQFIEQVKAAPNLTVQEAQPNFQLMYYGYKITRPMVSDKRVREAMNIAINRAEIVKGVMLGNAEPAYTFVDPKALDFAEKTKGIIKEDVERAKKLLDEAGWKVGSDGIREKDGMKLAPRVLFTQVAYFPRVSEAIQGFMRKIGVDWKIVGYDSTIAPAEMGKQDYELWTVTVPYLSAGELMNIYFNSKNIPTPNRMNWKDAETDEWLNAGRAALTDAERALNYARVQEKVMSEHLMMPVMNVAMYTTSSKKMKGVRPHMLYQNTFYKGLDYSF